MPKPLYVAMLIEHDATATAEDIHVSHDVIYLQLFTSLPVAQLLLWGAVKEWMQRAKIDIEEINLQLADQGQPFNDPAYMLEWSATLLSSNGARHHLYIRTPGILSDDMQRVE